jgi:hypothetical protein
LYQQVSTAAGVYSWQVIVDDLRALATRFAAAYAPLAGVRAVLLTGSVARGWADRYSDIELMVFWDGEPDQQLRHQAARDGGGTMVTCWDYDEENEEWSDDILLDGVEIQVSHRDRAATADWIADVVEDGDTSLTKQDLIALIQFGVPLAGDGLIASWRDACKVYPDALAAAMLAEYADFRSVQQRAKLLERGELLALSMDLTQSARNVFLCLLAHNRVYFPHLGYKWIRPVLRTLPDVPADAADRLDAVVSAPPAEAVAAADALIADTLRLVGADDELAALYAQRPTR